MSNKTAGLAKAREERSLKNRSSVEQAISDLQDHDEAKHVEALLRNKIEKLKKNLGTVRHENARLKNRLEKERGISEHWRRNWIKASSK